MNTFIPFSHKSTANGRVAYVWQNGWAIECGKLFWVSIPGNDPEQCFSAKWAVCSLFNAAKARGVELESNADILAITRR